ncbi:hypothetical protein [Nocardioides montaniterrae]
MNRPPLWTILLGLPVGAGVIAIGIALIGRSTTAVGTGWASLFVVLGVVLLLSDAALLAPDRAARRVDLRLVAGLLDLALLGAWSLAMAVIALGEHAPPAWVLLALALTAFLWGAAVVGVRRARA